MRTDFTRRTFRSARHYTGVLQQQGRVLLDADFNEQVEIERHQRRMLARDLIGACGGSEGAAGFEISLDESGRQLIVGAGRYYVDGLLVENERDCAFESQPDLPTAADLLAQSAESGGRQLAYLDVWERIITPIEDPGLVEPALGGPDTSVRIKTVWQVRLSPRAKARRPDCLGDNDEAERPALEVRTDAGGYTGLENHLYRIEVHSVDEAGRARFKWSRDNASLTLAVERIDEDALTVGDSPPDSLERLATGDWLELTDDALELDGAVGHLAQVAKVDATSRSISLTEPATLLSDGEGGVDRSLHPKARRWHSVTEMPPESDSPHWAPLEDGIEVAFSGGGEYRAGDYWLIPARTASRDVDWPGGPQRAERVEHSCCPLAVVELGPRGKRWRVIEDRRRLFAPLSA
jgi:hypothetical protein